MSLGAVGLPASFFYGLGVLTRRLAYDLGLAPVVRPSIASRKGTALPSAYAELLPFRLPFCHDSPVGGVFPFAH